MRAIWSSHCRIPVQIRCCGRPASQFWSASRSKSSIFGTTPRIRQTRCEALHHLQSRRLISQLQRHDSTIYALSTAAGRAAIAIVRISGPACLDVYHALCPGKRPLKPRLATLRTLYDPGELPSRDTVLDSDALVLYFPSPRTVTGEDVLELHVHGGPAVVKAVLAAIPRCSGSVRYAEPGEFTRRAFLNDRLDLTQVEALGDTLSAATEQQRRLSVRGATNGLGKQYEEWRQLLLYARGELEALIDFSEDQHFDESPTELCASVLEQVQVLISKVRAHAWNAVRGEMLRNGISIALLGAPNAGKSSLLNCVVGRQAAIVSHEAGTTRDIVEVGIDIGGYFCRIGDTAGLRRGIAASTEMPQPVNAIGHIEEEGMRRARERAAQSDVVIVVVSFEPTTSDTYALHLDPEVISSAALLVKEKNNVIFVINKSDTASSPEAYDVAVHEVMEALPGIDADRIHLISCKQANSAPVPPIQATNHEGTRTSEDPGNLQGFLHGLIQHFGALTAAVTPDLADGATQGDLSIWQDSLGASERHRLLLERCLESLQQFSSEVQLRAEGTELDAAGSGAEPDIVLAAEHLRAAADCLAKITGKGTAGDVEEVLGVVFEKFCVGK